jgi:hypothetical protein
MNEEEKFLLCIGQLLWYIRAISLQYNEAQILNKAKFICKNLDFDAEEILSGLYKSGQFVANGDAITNKNLMK